MHSAFFFLLSWILVVPALAENRLIYFGGGNSKSPGDKMFDQGFLDLDEYAKKQNWKSDFYYRKKLPSTAPDDLKAKTKVLSYKSFEEKIGSLVADIQSGKIKPQDQLLIYIDTHGGVSPQGELIIVGDGETLSASSLKKLIMAAEEKGVKLGIVAQNCYSGKILDYAVDNTCVISGSERDRASLLSDGNSFTENLRKSAGATNLEKNFIESRLDAVFFGPVVSQPMISTPEGKIVAEILWPLHGRIRTSSTDETEIRKSICRNSTSGLEVIDETAQAISEGSKNAVSEELLTMRKKSMLDLRNDILEYDQLENDLFAHYNYRQKPICLLKKSNCYTTGQLISNALYLYDKIEDCQKKPHYVKCDQEIKKLRDLEDYFETDEYKNYQKVRLTFLSNKGGASAKLEKLAESISMRERILYHRLYKDLSSKSKGSNACRDFKL